MATAAKKEPSVQEVRNIGLEDRLDKVISLIEAQNKAWQKCLTLLTEMNTLLFEKYKSADLLLEEHLLLGSMFLQGVPLIQMDGLLGIIGLS